MPYDHIRSIGKISRTPSSHRRFWASKTNIRADGLGDLERTTATITSGQCIAMTRSKALPTWPARLALLQLHVLLPDDEELAAHTAAEQQIRSSRGRICLRAPREVRDMAANGPASAAAKLPHPYLILIGPHVLSFFSCSSPHRRRVTLVPSRPASSCAVKRPPSSPPSAALRPTTTFRRVFVQLRRTKV